MSSEASFRTGWTSSASDDMDGFLDRSLAKQLNDLAPDARALSRADRKLAELADRGVLRGPSAEWVKTGRAHPVTRAPMYRGHCACCGDPTTVPFKPTPGRRAPVCRACMR